MECFFCETKINSNPGCCPKCLVQLPLKEHQVNPVNKIQLVRGRIARNIPGAMDTTVKSGNGLGKLFAPTWPMVLGSKNFKEPGRYPGYAPLSWDQYVYQYVKILDRQFLTQIGLPEALVAFGRGHENRIVFQCYCLLTTPNCHNEILMKYLVDKYPEYFQLAKL